MSALRDRLRAIEDMATRARELGEGGASDSDVELLLQELAMETSLLWSELRRGTVEPPPVEVARRNVIDIWMVEGDTVHGIGRRLISGTGARIEDATREGIRVTFRIVGTEKQLAMVRRRRDHIDDDAPAFGAGRCTP